MSSRLHVPEDWQLPWARQYSFTGDFSSFVLTQDFPAKTWIETPDSCHVHSGAPSAGFKWRAWRGPMESLTATTDRLQNYVILRGGYLVPSAAAQAQYDGVVLIVGTYYDSDADGTPDTYRCSSGAATTITVP